MRAQVRRPSAQKKMGCGASKQEEANELVSNPPLPKGHKFLAELAFLSEVQQGWRSKTAPCPDHLGWLAQLGDDAIAKWVKEITDTSTKRRDLEEAGTTVEAFEAWGEAIGPAIDDKSISPYALQITWEVGKHANLARDGTVAQF